MANCKLLDIEMDTNRLCPVSKQFKNKFLCYIDCGFSSLRDKNKKRMIQARLDIYT